MEHILNMGYSLSTIKYFVELQVAKGIPSVDIYYKATYPFGNAVEYEQEVMEYLVKNNNENLNKTLQQHLSTCEEIVKIWDERLKFMALGASRIRYCRENNINVNDRYEIHCILRKNLFSRFEEIILLRINNRKKEIGNPDIKGSTSWQEYIPELITIPITKDRDSTMGIVDFAKGIKSFLSKYVSETVRSQTKEQIELPQQQIALQGNIMKLPEEVLEWLQKTICSNHKPYIDNATAKTPKWLQNKQLARELLTHDKIRGSRSKTEAEEQAPKIFTYKGGAPLILAKPKKIIGHDSDNLSNYLATL